jgi:hypothetical protein
LRLSATGVANVQINNDAGTACLAAIVLKKIDPVPSTDFEGAK